MRLRGAGRGDPYFVWLTVVMLAAFGTGLTNPHIIRPTPPVADLSDFTDAAEMRPAIPAAFTPTPEHDPDSWNRSGLPSSAPVPGTQPGSAFVALDARVKAEQGNEGDSIKNDPALAIVVDDLGASPEVAARAAALPKPITLSFLPLGPAVAAQARSAQGLGHEVLLHLPMEAIEEDAGAGALKLADAAPTIAAKLRASLALVPGAIGLNNHMGSRFTADASAVSRLAGALRGLDLLFLDSRTVNSSLAARFVRGAGLPVAERELFADHAGATPEDVLAALAHAEFVAGRKGSIVLIAHPYPNTLAALEAWSARGAGRRVALVSLSEHVRRVSAAGERIASIARVRASAY